MSRASNTPSNPTKRTHIFRFELLSTGLRSFYLSLFFSNWFNFKLLFLRIFFIPSFQSIIFLLLWSFESKKKTKPLIIIIPDTFFNDFYTWKLFFSSFLFPTLVREKRISSLISNHRLMSKYYPTQFNLVCVCLSNEYFWCFFFLRYSLKWQRICIMCCIRYLFSNFLRDIRTSFSSQRCSRNVRETCWTVFWSFFFWFLEASFFLLEYISGDAIWLVSRINSSFFFLSIFFIHGAIINFDLIFFFFLFVIDWT